MPKKTEDEKSLRNKTVQDATKYATEVPFRIMETAYKSLEVIKAMAESGIPNSVTDAGVGALALRSCILGASLNVRINAGGLADREYAGSLIAKAAEIEKNTIVAEKEIIDIVNIRIS